MAPNLLNSSNLEHLALKGLMLVCHCAQNSVFSTLRVLVKATEVYPTNLSKSGKWPLNHCTCMCLCTLTLLNAV